MSRLKKLLENAVLNDETKEVIEKEISEIRESVLEEARKQLEVEYAKKLTEEKNQLNESFGDIVAELVTKEIEELKEDIERYRNLDVEYAKKLNDFKAKFANDMASMFDQVVEEHVKAEIDELREDLMEAKKQNFGQRLFEAFAEEFNEFGVDEDTKELRARLGNLNKKLEESRQTISQMEREKITESLLSNLTGSKREVMRTILENVSTDRLEERYNEVIDSVLQEDTKNNKQKEEKEAITESADENISKMRRLMGVVSD